MSALNLDPASPDYLKTLGYIPQMRSSYQSPAVTPNLDNPNGVFIYVPDYATSDTVAVVDPATLAEVDTIELDGNVSDRNLRPNDVDLTPDGTLLYTANLLGNSVSIVDAVTRQVVGALTNGGDLVQPQDLVITPTDTGAGVFVYVLARDTAGDPFLFIFEAGNTSDATALVDQIPLPLYPRSLAISQDGETVYVAANVGYPDLRSEVYVVDVRPSERVIADQIDLPNRIYKLIEAPDDQLLYLTSLWNSVVFVVDLTPGAGYPLITTLKTPGCPLDVAVEPSAGVVHPTVVSVIPSSGCPDGGDPVTITGINFSEGAEVKFGSGNFDPNVVVEGNFAISAVTPAGTGTVDVTVKNQDGNSHTLFGAFSYEYDSTPLNFTTPPYVASQALVGVPGSETVTVEIRWKTDAASDSLVEHRQVGQTTFLQVSDTTLTTNHMATVTGLTPATSYEFRATSAKNCGTPVSSPPEPGTFSFTTLSVPDTTPPEISAGGPTATPNIYDALIQWETNEVATSVVLWDPQIDGNLDRQTVGPDGNSHSVTLTGLQPHTEYEFMVQSADASGNATSSAVKTFTTLFLPDDTPPVIISGPEATYLADDLVIIQWQTDEPSTSFVNYGTSSILEQGVVDIDMVHNHVVFLTNLLPGTVYYYQVGSTDPSGNTVLSIDPLAKTLQTTGTSRLTDDLKAGVVTLRAGAYLTKAEATSGFTTPELPDTTAPQVLSVSVTPLSFDRVLVTVETDEDTSLRAHFGVAGLTDSVFDPTFGQLSSMLLAGLAGDTTYQLSVELADPKGNTTTMVQPTFSTPAEPDTQPPVISALSINPITDTTALLTWTTVEPADATVYFGVQGRPLDRQVGRLGLRTAHEILLTGLNPATTYEARASSRDASNNVGTASPTAFTTASAAPVISSVTPTGAVQGSTVEVAVNGAHLEGATVDFGTGVNVGAVTVNESGTQVRAEITVDPSAAVGPRPVILTTVHGSATASFSVVDETVPVVEILSPLNGAELNSLTVAVYGTVSELAEVTVNGVPATVTEGAPITFDATVTLSGSGLRGISATAIDPSGNRGTDTISVTVTNQPPVAVCADVSVSADASCRAAITPATIDGGSYDPDGTPLVMTVDPAILSGLGPHAVTLMVDDGEIQDSCEATVTVVDDTPPIIDAIAADPSVLWPPNHKMKRVKFDLLSSDICDVEAQTCIVTNVTSDEPIIGCDDDDKEPDWEIDGELSVKLRAERCGEGDGRIYTITVTCTDAAGNTADATTVVAVPHDQGG
jgi:YVTN family beta-propeller protein